MKTSKHPKLNLAVAVATGLTLTSTAHASLLAYEGFNYTANAALAGQSGGTGFTTSWSVATNTPNGYVAIKADGATSDVILSGSTLTPYTNTYSNLPDTGNYVGPSAGIPNGSTGNAPDHISMWRTLDSSVTATFVNGTKTYFSFTSARAFTSNTRAPSFVIGAGIVKTEALGDRGDTISAGPSGSKAAIAVGGITKGAGTTTNYYPGATVNGVTATTATGQMTGMYLPQSYNSAGVRTYGPAVGGGAFSSVNGTGPQPGDHAYWMQGGGGTTGVGSLLYGYSSVNTPVSGYGDNASKVNIIVGEIQWGAGASGADLLSYYVFHDNDALTEASFDSGKATWDTATVSLVDGNRSTWNQLSIAGARYFTDEIRLATSFTEVMGGTLAAVPEPTQSLGLMGLLGLGALLRTRRNKPAGV